MGAVYRARQKSLNREVAIKILPPTIEDGDMHYSERFIAEAQSMARLEHPGIIAVYDAGQTPGGLLYFVMQYVQGTDVAQMIAASGKLPPEHAYAITAHVCEALAYAHKNGLMHRDIKPANIMVDLEGRVKVADFGLAKAVDAQTGYTQSNMAVGTPDFVAPEALIPGMPVDGRADLYAVGVMLYQMLTGSIPRGAFKPASEVVPGLDARFDQVVFKAMQVDREERHSSATELRQHLDTLLIPAAPAPDLQRYSSAGMPKRDADSPVRTQQAPGAPSARRPASVRVTPAAPPPAKSKTPLFIGIGAAAVLGIGAFVLFGGGKAKQSGPLSPLSGAPSVAGASTPAPVTERATPLPPVKVVEPPKQEPKPVVVAKVEPAKVEPAKPDLVSEPPAGSVSPAPTKAVSPMPDGPGISATALQDAAAPKAAKSGPLNPSEAEIASQGLPEERAQRGNPLSGAPSAPAATGTAQGTVRTSLPPELAALDAQFIALQKERVTVPFEAEVAKLNAGYLGGIGKKIAEEKAAGHLDGILALEAEQKLIQGMGAPGPQGASEPPLPSDDDKTPASLKALRAIYCGQFTKLAATRAANLKALTDPLDKRLAQMESDFAKSDRLADAKLVRGYREVLRQSGPLSPLSGAPSVADTSKPAQGTVRTTLAPAAALELKDGITNTLGMRFLPVKGTEVLFCIHETRYKDYAAYTAEAANVATNWKNQTHDGYALTERAEDHPVVNVSWEEAQAFCAWLSMKEGKTYRLPTDEEWSIAVGLGRKEKHGKNITPAMLSSKESTEFPWDGDFPPKTKDQAGNYSDASRKGKAPHGDAQYLDDCDDGFPTTAPVMSFKPNKLGLYDLGGNVWEWCEDWLDNAKIERVLRGCSWFNHERGNLLSSYRLHHTPARRHVSNGFRCVLVVSSSAP